MKTKVTRRGDRWCFRLEAKVFFKHYEMDPRPEAHDVLGDFTKRKEEVFDEALAGTGLTRGGNVEAILAWDKQDPLGAGHPWAEPDSQDDFPGFCCWPGCGQKSLWLKPVCLEHLKHVCLECGKVRLPEVGCACDGEAGPR